MKGDPAIADSNNRILSQTYISGDEKSLAVNDSFTITISGTTNLTAGSAGVRLDYPDRTSCDVSGTWKVTRS